MKTLITVSCVAGVLLAAVRWSGQSIDAGSVFAIVVASFLTALFVRDYRTPPGPARAPKDVPVPRRLPVRVIAKMPVMPRARGGRSAARFARSAGARSGAISIGS
jgi:hypothetical protein